MISPLSEKLSSQFANSHHPLKNAIAFGSTVILTSIIVTVGIVGVRQIGLLEGFELAAYDYFIRSRPAEAPDPRVVVVGISEEDLEKLGVEIPNENIKTPNVAEEETNEPKKVKSISDATMAQFLKKIEEYEPRAIGIDILRDVPIGQGRQDLIKVLKTNEKIIAGCLLSSERTPGAPAAPGVPKERIGFADLPDDNDFSRRRTALVSTPTTPNQQIEKPHLCNTADPENQLPSLAFNVALLYLEKDNIVLEQTEDGTLKLGETIFKRLEDNVGGYRNLDPPDYQILINYRPEKNAIREVSLSEVLEGKISPSLVKDKIVILGYTALSKEDYFPTPYSGLDPDRVMPGVVVHAHIISQIISAVWDNRPLIWYWPFWGEVWWIFGWAVVGGSLGLSLRRPLLLVLAVGGASAILYGASYFIFLKSAWIPLVPATLGVVVTAGSVVLIDRYSKRVTKAVQQLFRMGLEIDTDQVPAAVEAITETETLEIVEEKARQRQNSTNNTKIQDITPLTTDTSAEIPIIQDGETRETDVREDFQEKDRQLINLQEEVKVTDTAASNSQTSEEITTTHNEETKDLEIIEDLPPKNPDLSNQPKEIDIADNSTSNSKT